MKFVLSSILIVVCYLGFGRNNKPMPDILMDPNFTGRIVLYNKPGGKWIKLLRHNFKGEDFICMQILGQNDSMFLVSVDYSIAGHIANGWVKKSEHIGVYNKNDNQGLPLYSLPNIESPIAVRLEKSTYDFLKVVGFEGNWLKVEKKVKGRLKRGWLPLELQCANPYTTCC